MLDCLKELKKDGKIHFFHRHDLDLLYYALTTTFSNGNVFYTYTIIKISFYVN